MTIQDLINKLSEYDRNMPVVYVFNPWVFDVNNVRQDTRFNTKDSLEDIVVLE